MRHQTSDGEPCALLIITGSLPKHWPLHSLKWKCSIETGNGYRTNKVILVVRMICVLHCQLFHRWLYESPLTGKAEPLIQASRCWWLCSYFLSHSTFQTLRAQGLITEEVCAVPGFFSHHDGCWDGFARLRLDVQPDMYVSGSTMANNYTSREATS